MNIIYGYLLFVVGLVLTACAVVAFSIWLTWAWFETGPNCPGKDPSWLGWCSEAPDHG